MAHGLALCNLLIGQIHGLKGCQPIGSSQKNPAAKQAAAGFLQMHSLQMIIASMNESDKIKNPLHNADKPQPYRRSQTGFKKQIIPNIYSTTTPTARHVSDSRKFWP